MVRKPKGIWRRFKYWLRTTYWITARKVAIVLAGVAVLVALLGSLAQHGLITIPQLVLDLWGNFSSELAGIVITVWVIDTLNRRRSIAEEKEDLILQMGSPDNAFALEAVRKLRARGWLDNGSLRKASLDKADLRGAELSYADLEGVHLTGARLTDARLYGAKLKSAMLADANLGGAILIKTDLEGANLAAANLQSTDMRGANLSGAIIVGKRDELQFDQNTILPDESFWTAKIDNLARFTDPNHPNFWRSVDPNSPAHIK